MQKIAARTGRSWTLLAATIVLSICPWVSAVHAQQAGTLQYHYDHYLTAYGLGDLEGALESVQWILQNDPYFPEKSDANFRWAIEILFGLMETGEPEQFERYREEAARLVDEALTSFSENGVVIDSLWWEEARSRLDSVLSAPGPLSERAAADTLVAVLSVTGSQGETSFTSDTPWEVHWEADRWLFNVVATPFADDAPGNEHYLITDVNSPEKGSVCVSAPGRYALSVFTSDLPSGTVEWNVIVLRSTIDAYEDRQDCHPLASFQRID